MKPTGLVPSGHDGKPLPEGVYALANPEGERIPWEMTDFEPHSRKAPPGTPLDRDPRVGV